MFFGDDKSGAHNYYKWFAGVVVDISFNKDGIGVLIEFSISEIYSFEYNLGKSEVAKKLLSFIQESVELGQSSKKIYYHYSLSARTFKTFSSVCNTARILKKRTTSRLKRM